MPSTHFPAVHALALFLLPSLAAAGCGGASDPPPVASTSDARVQAAQQTATASAACAGLSPFYWEIGDASGPLASGQGGSGAGAVDPNAAMPIASASKLIFGAYVLQTHGVDELVASGADTALNLTSGYDTPDDLSCLRSDTVADCFHAGNHSVFTPANVGRFAYGSCHMQAYAVNVAGLGGDHRSAGAGTPKLADDIQKVVGDIGLSYAIPLLAGGAKIPPSGYARFLRDVLSGKLEIGRHLGERAVCAWTHHDDCNALYSPVNESSPSATTNDVSDLKWHYALAHWVEDDGTFSSTGLFGFYPWIDSTKRYYGIVARYDRNIRANPPPGHASSTCGRAIRAAWLSGVAQP